MVTTNFTETRHLFAGPDPGPPQPGVMQVFVDENGIPLMVDFLCPCGCGHTCPLHLETPTLEKKHKDDHHWCYSPGPTINPSVQWTGGCKSHFTIEKGVVNLL